MADIRPCTEPVLCIRWIARLCVLVPVLALAAEMQASAQIVEAVGSRALGMGGAFVAVANDGTATWWNPGALAAGPFLDMALARAVTDSSRQVPARRDRASWFVIGTPPLGVSYYHLRLTEASGPAPTAAPDADRQEEQGPVPVRSLDVRQFGATIVQALTDGVHIGTTLKYVRGRMRGGIDASFPPSEALDLGEDLGGGDTEHKRDLDIGILAAGGPVRVGVLVRNVREPVFGTPDAAGEMRLPRQVRIGAAFDGDAVDLTPLTLSFDADVRRYETVSGDRRVVAVGAEQWLFSRRLGLRAGGRINTVGAEDRAATAGVSINVWSRLYVDGHVVRGGSDDDRGWGIAARVSF